MKKTAILLAALIGLTGCATWQGMSENEKKTAMWVGGIIVTGAIIAAAADGDTTITTNQVCHDHKHNHDCD